MDAFHNFLIFNDKELEMTRTQHEFAELLLKSIEGNEEFKKNMQQPGDRRKVFELIQQFYRKQE